MSKLTGSAVVILFSILIQFATANNCIVCNSGTDNTCHHPAAFNLVPQPCLATNTWGCFTRTNLVGHTIRGCTNTLLANTECEGDTLCATCDAGTIGNNCNNAISPPTRLLCHQCTGAINSPCFNAPTTAAQVCPVFSNSDLCFVRRSATQGVTRGCMSSRLNQGVLVCTDSAECLMCTGNGCNSHVADHQDVPHADTASIKHLSMFMFVSVALSVLKSY